MLTVEELGRRAQIAERTLSVADNDTRNRALLAMADALEAQAERIIAANGLDLAAGKENGLSAALLDRLALDEKRIKGVADAMREVTALLLY